MTGAAWAEAAVSAETGRPLARDQFERHGFVHCCFREQLQEIATWWFHEEDELFSLELDPAALTAELRLEPSPSRWYPHVYGPLDARAVIAVHELARSSSGVVELPPALATPPAGFQVSGRLEGDAESTERVVRWREGRLFGDAAWIATARSAIEAGQRVPLVGGISAPPDLRHPYESFALLDVVAAEVIRYDGDGFFGADP